MGKKLTMEQHRKILLDELIFITDLCDKNGIKYFLYRGTLLGAVKYRGFIPWDDDVDIALLRNDYEKLLSILEKNENENYKVLHMNNTKDYYYSFAKLVCKKTKLIENAKEIKELGVYIDIFPLDGIADNYNVEMRKIRFLKNLVARRMRIKNQLPKTMVKERKTQKNRYKYFKNFMYAFIDYITLPLGYNFFVKKLDKKLKLYNKREHKYVSRYSNFDGVFDKKLFDEIDTYTFENKEFKSVKNYDLYLKQLYGDYTKELPKEEQRSHHQIKVLWRDSNE